MEGAGGLGGRPRTVSAASLAPPPWPALLPGLPSPPCGPHSRAPWSPLLPALGSGTMSGPLVLALHTMLPRTKLQSLSGNPRPLEKLAGGLPTKCSQPTDRPAPTTFCAAEAFLVTGTPLVGAARRSRGQQRAPEGHREQGRWERGQAGATGVGPISRQLRPSPWRARLGCRKAGEGLCGRK